MEFIARETSVQGNLHTKFIEFVQNLQSSFPVQSFEEKLNNPEKPRYKFHKKYLELV